MTFVLVSPRPAIWDGHQRRTDYDPEAWKGTHAVVAPEPGQPVHLATQLKDTQWMVELRDLNHLMEILKVAGQVTFTWGQVTPEQSIAQ